MNDNPFSAPEAVNTRRAVKSGWEPGSWKQLLAIGVGLTVVWMGFAALFVLSICFFIANNFPFRK